MDVSQLDIKEFNDWCKYGIKNYPNFPIGRTDKLGPSVVSQFLQWKFGISEEESLKWDVEEPWREAICKEWRKL